MNKKENRTFDNDIIEDLENPFDNSFSREKLQKFSKNISDLILSEAKDKPFTVFLEAPFGFGKTTFIDMWGQQLVNDGHIALKFNAWKHDYENNPLPGLLSAIQQQLDQFNLKIHDKQLEKLKVIFESLVITYTSLANYLHYSSAFGWKIVVSTIIKILSCKIFQKTKLQSNEKIIQDLKSVLGKIISEEILFIFIDELDRCKPTFAIKTLELIKHIFDIKQVCFIISVNQDALAQTVSSVYGYDSINYKNRDAAQKYKDSKLYLERFSDKIINLPMPSKSEFIKYRLSALSSDKIFTEKTLVIIDACCRKFDFSLREINKFIADIKHFISMYNEIECNAKYGPQLKEKYLSASIYLLAQKRADHERYEDIKTMDWSKAVPPQWLQRELSISQNLEFMWSFMFLRCGSSPSLLKKIMTELQDKNMHPNNDADCNNTLNKIYRFFGETYEIEKPDVDFYLEVIEFIDLLSVKRGSYMDPSILQE